MRAIRFSKQGKATLFTAVLFLALSFPALAAEWTFMVYIGGDNNLSSAAIQDIQEMAAASSSANVNVVVQAELSPSYTFQSDLPSYMSNYNTYRLAISNGQIAAQDIGNQNMGDPGTLAAFIQWAAGSYPASKYALTIWDHGAGWKETRGAESMLRGAVEDSTSGSFMSLAQLGQGVAAGGVHLNLLDFDACLMAMYEVAYEFIGNVDYLVFSEDVEPGDGNPYTPILNSLAANPSMDARSLASIIVTEFVNSYTGSRNSVTKSAVDMSQISSLHASLLDLAQTMQSSISTYGAAINSARASTLGYEYAANLDLGHLLSNLSTVGGDVGTKAGQLYSFLINSVVSAESHYSSTYSEGGYVSARNVDNSTGLAIFFPGADQLQQGELSQYSALTCNASGSGWSAFLNDILTYTGGSSATQGSVSTSSGSFAFAAYWVDDQGLGGWADVDLYVLEPDGSFGCPWFGQSTSNGNFSEDSYYSGDSYETYVAKDTVMSGAYWMIINFYGGYYSSTYVEDYANVFALWYDPYQGHTSWNFYNTTPFRMSLYNPAPEYWDYNVLMGIVYGYYSDWWLPLSVQRAIMDMTSEEQLALMENVKTLSQYRDRKRARMNMELLKDYLEQMAEEE